MRRILLLIFFGAAGCATPPVADTDELDERWAWPCERLIVGWPIDTNQLQQLAGPHPAVTGTTGELQLSVDHCGAGDDGDGNAITAAYILIPVTRESAPFVLTKVADDGWLYLHSVAAQEQWNTHFAKIDQAVINATVAFDAEVKESGSTIAMSLEFDRGSISILAEAGRGYLPHRTTKALLGGGDGFVSAFFGDENAQRQADVKASVTIVGTTPLSPLSLPNEPAWAFFDTNLRSEWVYWRMPTPSH